VQEGQDPEEVKNAVWADAASAVPPDADIATELVSFDATADTALIRFVKYGNTPPEGDAPADAEADADADADADDEEVAGTDGAGAPAAEGGKPAQKEGKEGKGGKKSKLDKKKSSKKIAASGPTTHVATAKDPMGVRDFIVGCVRSGKKIGSGSIRDLARADLHLRPARIFVGAAREDSYWERAGLYMSVMPALKRRLRDHRFDISWLDWYHVASTHSPNCVQEWSEILPGQCPRGPFGPTSQHQQPSQWRCMEALDQCTMPVPDGTHRPCAVLLVGNGPDHPISAIDEYILKQRLPEVLPPQAPDAELETATLTRVPSGRALGDGKAKRAASAPVRPSLLQLVLARLGLGDKSGSRWVSRQLLFSGKSLDINDSSPIASPRDRSAASPTSLAPAAKEAGSPKDKGVPQAAPDGELVGEANGEEEESIHEERKSPVDKGASGAFVVPGGPQQVVCEPVCLLKEKAPVQNEIFVREVPAMAREFCDAEVCALEDKVARRAVVDGVAAQLALVKSVPGMVNRYGLTYRCTAPRAGQVGADKTLCWSTVHVKGLPVPPTGEDAQSMEDYLGQTQLVFEAFHFELPTRFSAEEIDLRYTYLCNRGHNAVVTYKGDRSQIAAALATQKQQIRMSQNVRVTLKGCDTSTTPQANALCDDADMTLVDVAGIPKGTSEAQVFGMLRLPLVECSVYPNPVRAEGEHTGSADLLYDSNETALRVQRALQGEPFKILRPRTEHDPISSFAVTVKRAESDPVGYLKASGLPYNISQADAMAFFDIRASEEYSVLRRDKVSAVLALRHFKAATLLVAGFDRSRPWGLTGERLSFTIVDPASASSRVFASHLPFALNEKLHDPEKILKDLMHKEKDLLQVPQIEPCQRQISPAI